jgi:hypothetical protein
MAEKIQVVFEDPMWCVVCPTHGKQCFATRAEAEQRAADHANEDETEWEVA